MPLTHRPSSQGWAPGVLPLWVCMCMCVCVFGGLSSFYWRAGASQPSRTTGTIFLYIYIYPGAAFSGGRCTYCNVV